MPPSARGGPRRSGPPRAPLGDLRDLGVLGRRRPLQRVPAGRARRAGSDTDRAAARARGRGLARAARRAGVAALRRVQAHGTRPPARAGPSGAWRLARMSAVARTSSEATPSPIATPSRMRWTSFGSLQLENTPEYAGAPIVRFR